MPKKANQKLRLLEVLKILQRYSDENHTLTVEEIQKKLSLAGMYAERKAIYDDLYALEEGGYDLLRTKGRGGGVRLLSRTYETAECKLLLDAVASSRFIPEDKSLRLMEKISSEASVYEGVSLKRHFYMGNKQKSLNEKVLYAVDTINEALNSQKMIEFLYSDRDLQKRLFYRHGGKIYAVSPWELTVFDNNYYLIAYDPETSDLRHFRVDKMEQVTVSARLAEGREKVGELNLNDYCSPVFGMFAGEKTAVTIQAPKKLAGVFLDRFGMDILLVPETEKEGFFHTTVPVIESPPFFGWLLSLGKDVRILFPETTREHYREALKQAADENA